MLIYTCLVGIFFVFFVFVTKLITNYLELQEEVGLQNRKNSFKGLSKKKVALIHEKIDIESEAMKTFTLYEITKDIVKSLNEKDAFEIFKTRIRDHLMFDDCFFLSSKENNQLAEFKDKEEYFIFIVRGEKKTNGYLVIQGLSDLDHEKFLILAHQFALALRRVKLYQEVEKIAITDSLTEVYTRYYAFDRLEEEMKRSEVKNMHLSFLMIDVDFFKNFNDKYGHLTGDQILSEIGNLIKQSIREIDIPGRFGGEEFCVVLPDTDRDGAEFAAERIREAVELTTIKAYDNEVTATVSVGISTFPEDAKNVDELVDKADWALYRAKKQGRNRVCSFGVYKDLIDEN